MQTIIDPTLREAVEAFIGNLLASEVLIQYHQAQARLHADQHANELLKNLSQAQADLRKKQSNGRVTQTEIDALRKLQDQVQANPLIMTYAHTQQEAVMLLRAINAEISELLGINFASFTNHATC